MRSLKGGGGGGGDDEEKVALLLGRRGGPGEGNNGWVVVEGVAGIIEEERLDGLGIVNPRSEYLCPSTPVLPPSMLTLSKLLLSTMYVMAL